MCNHSGAIVIDHVSNSDGKDTHKKLLCKHCGEISPWIAIDGARPLASFGAYVDDKPSDTPL